MEKLRPITDSPCFLPTLTFVSKHNVTGLKKVKEATLLGKLSISSVAAIRAADESHLTTCSTAWR